ncbi:hypoxanthine-guanine phosphoribosyltransferase-like isoform X3 [Hydractinia symbiolongicarpus]|uniref:hypoxanthine-guanine phosphoribosyltransferase-like isoform X3 n=1 Tax=Hydractinia symbiolongicarpus TaxID=13093 RepID=UPI00254DF457|nr:hypoxanthine-guanine phosphoribosyltransferase-like isoform X3 [Hydractinia symbiolongicarpus]
MKLTRARFLNQEILEFQVGLFTHYNELIPEKHESKKDIIVHIIHEGNLIIERMAKDIHEGFEAESMTILCILKGGFKFCQDLMHFIKAINRNSGKSIQLGLDFLRVRSYKNEQSCDITIEGSDDLTRLKEKDIVDTGRTMQKLLATLQQYQPKSIKVATLLVKRRPDSTGYKPDYIGFETPNKFLGGYALDYNEYFRDMDHICVVNDAGKKKYAIR